MLRAAFAASLRLAGECRGTVAPIVALALIPLALAAGLAIDVGRALLVRAELARAADSAALAAGARGDDPNPVPLVRRFLQANFRGDGTVRLDDVRVTAGDDGRIAVTVQARVATTLMRLAGIEEVPVAVRTVVARATRPLEVALVLDVTGSMRCCGKIQALRRAASDLVDILFQGRGVSDLVRIGIVPFNARVNVGNRHRDWLLPRDRSRPWNGCPEARSDATALTDAPPTVELFPARPARGRSGRGWGSWWGGWGRWGGARAAPCPPLAVLPLSFTRGELLSYIARLPATGTTRIDMGARWGWRLLSERWMGLWHEPVRHGRREEVLKAAVIMTDGANVVDDRYDEVGSEAEADANLLTLCTRMKDSGILVYTVTFRASRRSDRLMARCATSPAHHFRSPTNAELVRAFRSIAGELSALRIAE